MSWLVYKMANFGDKVISFIQRRKLNAIIIAILCFISPINLILWLCMVTSLYKKEVESLVKRGCRQKEG